MEKFDPNKKIAFLKLLEIFNPGSSEWDYAMNKLSEYEDEFLNERGIKCASTACQKNVKECL